MVDFDAAHSVYPGGGSFFNGFKPGAFMEYSPAYVATNEDIRGAIKIVNPKDKNVLITTGSGDGPMFYRIYGAKNVDSFDISYCAKAIMDVKVSALRRMDLNQYACLLYDLHWAKSFGQFQSVIDGCPIETQDFIRNMNGCRIFHNGSGIDKESLPNRREYSRMKKNITEEIPFIWSDLNVLSTKLTKVYDIIYLSNIFQYISDKNDILRILNSLKPHLTVGGHIMVHSTWFFGDVEINNYKWVAQQIKQWGRLYQMENKRGDNQYMFLQRTR